MDPPPGARLFRGSHVTSQTTGATSFCPIELDGREFEPKKGGWKTNAPGMERLKAADRLHIIGNTLTYLRYLDDFSVFPRNNLWDDTVTSGFGDAKVYVVQTNPRIVERCMLERKRVV